MRLSWLPHFIGEEPTFEAQVVAVALSPVDEWKGEPNEREERRVTIGKRLAMCIRASGFVDVNDSGCHGAGGPKVLGVTRQALNNVVNEKAAISAEMAIRLTKAFGSTPETWLAMQSAFDLAQARKYANKIKVKRYRRLRHAAA